MFSYGNICHLVSSFYFLWKVSLTFLVLMLYSYMESKLSIYTEVVK